MHDLPIQLLSLARTRLFIEKRGLALLDIQSILAFVIDSKVMFEDLALNILK